LWCWFFGSGCWFPLFSYDGMKMSSLPDNLSNSPLKHCTTLSA
jgi:hypothetical protein